MVIATVLSGHSTYSIKFSVKAIYNIRYTCMIIYPKGCVNI